MHPCAKKGGIEERAPTSLPSNTEGRGRTNANQTLQSTLFETRVSLLVTDATPTDREPTDGSENQRRVRQETINPANSRKGGKEDVGCSKTTKPQPLRPTQNT